MDKSENSLKEAKLNEESTKIYTQKEVNDTTTAEKKNYDEKEDTTNDWNHQINEAFSEYNALMAKFADKMKKVCKDSTEYFEERPKHVSNWIPNWPADKRMEKLLSFRDGLLKHLKGFLAIRGISKKNQNSPPEWFD